MKVQILPTLQGSSFHPGCEMRLGLASGVLVLCLEPTEPDRPLFPLQSWFSAFDVEGTLTSPGDSLGVAGDPLTLSHRVVSPLSFTGISCK